MEDLELGTCLKNADKTVLHQNELCISICGNMVGQICTKGCMHGYVPIPGMTLIKNSDVSTSVVDAVVINDGEHLTTLFYCPKEDLEKTEKNREELVQFGLSKSETTIFLLVMNGARNAEILKKLFISKSTLKTHLNNIYKKLPETYQHYKNRR